ncbi:MAG: DEAD/DEAH box helicase [Oscillospiraceae bacterium]|nr:DEAD/DEAH box helicase [Oscillospiraceae bacterium]
MSINNISDIIKYYDNIAYTEMSEQNFSVKLLPTFVINYDGYIYLELSVGAERTYVVKDPYDFAQKVKNAEYADYGKDFGFIHSITSFDEKSAEIAKFIVDMNEEYRSYSEKITEDFKYPTQDKSRFFVSNTGLDRLFPILSGDSVSALIYKSSTNELHFCDHNPKINLTLSQCESGFNLAFDFNNARIINGQANTYLIVGADIFRLSANFVRDVLPIIKLYMQHGYNPVLISENEMPKFYNFILPKLSNCIDIKNECRGLDKFLLPKFLPKLNLKSQQGNIILTPNFCYDDINFNPLISGDVHSEIRNIEKEVLLLNKIKSSGFLKSETNDSFYLDDEDKIYRFLKTHQNELEKMADLVFDETMENITLKTQDNLKIDVKADDNAINLSIDNIDLNETELDNLITSYQENREYLKLENGAYFDIDNEHTKTLDMLVNGLGVTTSDICAKNIKLPHYRALYLDSVLKNNKSVILKRNTLFKQMVENILNSSDIERDVPTDLNAELREYQKTGFKWLSSLADLKMGGILADDMGLGKTLQIISLLLSQKDDEKPSIIVTPASLVYNWQEEIKKFAPALSSMVISGGAEVRKTTLEKIGECNVVITSYDSIKRDIENYKKINFKFAVLDEAQYIKNHATQNAQSVKALNAEVRFALSGTPIENSLSELWSIFDFVLPNYLFDLPTFKKRFMVSSYGVKSAEMLTKLTKPFILRRMKREVLSELPPKVENVIRFTMQDDEQKLYKMYQMQYRREIEKLSQEGNNSVQILALLTRLRQLCCNPSLFIEDYNGSATKMNLAISLIKESAESGHKLLLFSQFTSMLDKIAKEVDLLGIPYLKLTGADNSANRIKMAHEFNENPDIKLFLISLKAGGTGLNLTSADMVIHYDPWWNLSAENQATDRSHRMGQKNSVTVYKLVAKDTIEERVLDIQTAKKQLFDEVIREGEEFIGKMSADELKQLLF